MSAKPVQSMPPVASPGVCWMPSRITKKTIVTTIAGSVSTTPIPTRSTSWPLVSAPTMTDSSRAPTRIAAPRRVRRSRSLSPRSRRWMIATSNGSQTTYAPWRAQPMRKVVKDGATTRIHEPSAVTAVEISSTRWWPIRSASRASSGTQSAETTSWAASNQLTSPSGMVRWSAICG